MEERVEPIVSVLMERYDNQFPTATPFQRGHVEYKSKAVVRELLHAGFKVTR